MVQMRSRLTQIEFEERTQVSFKVNRVWQVVVFFLACIGCGTTVMAEDFPSNYLFQGKMVIDPNNSERFTLSFGNNHPSRPLYCSEFAVISGAAELSLCSDPNAIRPVTSKLPNFSIDAGSRTDLADLGADAVKGFKLANGIPLTDTINLCDGNPVQKTGSCVFGCGPGQKEKRGKCLKTCANGIEYGGAEGKRVGCYYRLETCSTDGQVACTQSYYPGHGCPAVEDPGEPQEC
jgi:hypothetical protein